MTTAGLFALNDSRMAVSLATLFNRQFLLDGTMNNTLNAKHGNAVTAPSRQQSSSRKARSPAARKRSNCCPVKEGMAYSLRYPEHPFAGVVTTLQNRRVLVTSIRDLKRHPISLIEVEIQPLLLRSRFAIMCLDLDRRETVELWHENMRDIKELSTGESEMLSIQPAVGDVSSNAFVVIWDGKVVFQADDDLESAIGWRDDHAALGQCSLWGRMSASREQKAADEIEQRQKKPPRNPLDEKLAEISYDVERKIVDVTDHFLGEEAVADSEHRTGWRLNAREKGAIRREIRTATNAECGTWDFDLRCRGSVDLSRQLPEQMASWLRSQAEKLLQSADEIEQIEDTRNLLQIRRLVTGTVRKRRTAVN